jgi:hypothetical protein
MRSLANLRRARIRIHRQLDKLEPLVAGYYAKLAEVNAAILAIDPQRGCRPGRHFARGEVPRLALGVMREAGEPLPVAVIVRKMLAAKGVAPPHRRTFKLTKNRLHNALLALDARGNTTKVGRGNATRRGLFRDASPSTGAFEARRDGSDFREDRD